MAKTPEILADMLEDIGHGNTAERERYIKLLRLPRLRLCTITDIIAKYGDKKSRSIIKKAIDQLYIDKRSKAISRACYRKIKSNNYILDNIIGKIEKLLRITKCCLPGGD